MPAESRRPSAFDQCQVRQLGSAPRVQALYGSPAETRCTSLGESAACVVVVARALRATAMPTVVAALAHFRNAHRYRLKIPGLT